jgi:hypothetical protein
MCRNPSLGFIWQSLEVSFAPPNPCAHAKESKYAPIVFAILWGWDFDAQYLS